MLQSILTNYAESLQSSEFSAAVGEAIIWIIGNLHADSLHPSLIHGDLHQINVFVNKGQITGILDVDTATFASPKLELARIRYTHFRQMAPENEGDFIAGYSSVWGDTTELLADAKVYDLLMYVDQAYRLVSASVPNEKHIAKHRAAMDAYLSLL